MKEGVCDIEIIDKQTKAWAQIECAVAVENSVMNDRNLIAKCQGFRRRFAQFL